MTTASGTIRIPDAPTPAEYLRLARDIVAQPGDLAPLRVAVLSSFTMDFSRPYLVVEGARLGLGVTPWYGPFGQFEQVATDSGSEMYSVSSGALVLAMRPEDVDPDAVVRLHASSGARFVALIDDMIDRLLVCARAFRGRVAGPILVANFATPAHLPLGPLDANASVSLAHALAAANERLRARVAEVPGALVWDYAGLVAHWGAGTWSDPRLWSLARVPVASAHQPRLAAHLVRTLRAARQPAAKCLVLDLDQTIWGGVIGDDGLAGIKLSDEHPGSAFKSFQRHVLALRDRGVLLAVASKNDLDVARQVFLEHPEMLIRWDDLAAVRIDWSPKSVNILQMAAELNIGADAMVLFDDNPVERAEVRSNAPEVQVVDVPGDPLRYVTALHDAFYFDQVNLSHEDRVRAAMYQEERKRQLLAKSTSTPEEFLGSLRMVARVGLASHATLPRIEQLIAKTNQFNLTSRRYSAAELTSLASSPTSVVAWLRLADRFGDQGLVAVGILRAAGPRAWIEALLMSCRVMNRQVEQAMLAFLAEQARRLGCTELVGEYLPTRKNGIVLDLYPKLGFTALDENGTLFNVSLDAAALPWPRLLAREDDAGADTA